MAVQVDDPCVRQRAADESAIQIIQRHLVGETAGDGARGVDAGEIVAAERSEIHAGGLRDQFPAREVRPAAAAPRGIDDGERKVGEFARRLDL